MSPARPRSVPNLGPELEPRSRYSVRQQTDSGIAAVTAPRRGAPTQDFRGGEKPIALFSLQKTAKTASAPSHSHDSSGNDAPSLISNPATPAKAGAHGKSGSRPSPRNKSVG